MSDTLMESLPWKSARRGAAGADAIFAPDLSENKRVAGRNTFSTESAAAAAGLAQVVAGLTKNAKRRAISRPAFPGPSYDWAPLWNHPTDPVHWGIYHQWTTMYGQFGLYLRRSRTPPSRRIRTIRTLLIPS